jgi:hypothetical protein
LEELNANFNLSLGSLKEVSSSISLNGIKKDVFLSFETVLNKPFPVFSFTANIPSYNAEGLLNFIFKTDSFKNFKANADIAIGAKTYGLSADSLLKNLNANIVLKSEAIEIPNFNLEALSSLLSDQSVAFKNLPNPQILAKINSSGTYSLDSKMSLQNMEFGIEKLELKSPSSSNIFVGKLRFQPKKSFFLQMVGKTALAGADLNSNLKGLMPLYITSALSNKEDKIEIQFDYSQITQYSEARRVLYQ